MSRPVLFWLALVLLFMGSMALWAGYSFLHSGLGDKPQENALPETPLTEFTLLERSGREFHSKEMKGKIWATNFFFSSCPYECPAHSAVIRDLAREWGPRGVTFVSITVDPDRDTPSVLAEYARRFQAHQEHWLFLTGPMDDIKRIGTEFYLANVAKMTHSGVLILIDRDGTKRPFKFMEKPDRQRMEDHLEHLLAEMEQEKNAREDKQAGTR